MSVSRVLCFQIPLSTQKNVNIMRIYPIHCPLDALRVKLTLILINNHLGKADYPAYVNITGWRRMPNAMESPSGEIYPNKVLNSFSIWSYPQILMSFSCFLHICILIFQSDVLRNLRYGQATWRIFPFQFEWSFHLQCVLQNKAHNNKHINCITAKFYQT